MTKRYGKARTRYMRQEGKLTPNDRREVDRFKEFIKDSATLTPAELWAKHGEEYLGPKPGTKRGDRAAGKS